MSVLQLIQKVAVYSISVVLIENEQDPSIVTKCVHPRTLCSAVDDNVTPVTQKQYV